MPRPRELPTDGLRVAPTFSRRLVPSGSRSLPRQGLPACPLTMRRKRPARVAIVKVAELGTVPSQTRPMTLMRTSPVVRLAEAEVVRIRRLSASVADEALNDADPAVVCAERRSVSRLLVAVRRADEAVVTT